MSTPSPATRLSGKKRIAFWVLTIAFPLLVFVVLETTLRLARYGESWPLFVAVPGFEAYRFQNRYVARRYFRHDTDVPDAQSDAFRVDKKPNGYRLFVQGGSSAAGFPYHYPLFSSMLEQRLQATNPSLEIEVVNTAMAAVNSYTLLDLADEILEQQPDAVLIYARHNEYYGALGVASTESAGRSRMAVRMALKARRLRSYQLMEALVAGVVKTATSSRRAPQDPATRMERMVGNKQIVFGSDLYRRGLAQYRANLQDLLRKYRAAGVHVYVATLVSNERGHAPFAGDTNLQGAEGEEWRAAFQEGSGSTQPREALKSLDRAIALDSMAAAPYFRKAQILEQLGRVEEARRNYQAAKDRDALRFRAPQVMNEIVRELAQEPGVTLVDVEAAFSARSPHGIIGSELITEHLHPNIEGYFCMADAFYDALYPQSVAGDYVSRERARADVLVTQVDSIFGELRVQSLMDRWPFQPPGTNRDTVTQRRATTAEEQIALDLFFSRLTWTEALQRHLEDRLQHGDGEGALRAAKSLAQELGFHPQPFAQVGWVLLQGGDLTGALSWLKASLDHGETVQAQLLSGIVSLELGRPDRAVGHLERARELHPGEPEVVYQLAKAYADVGRVGEASELLVQLLRVDPGNVRARSLYDRVR